MRFATLLGIVLHGCISAGSAVAQGGDEKRQVQFANIDFVTGVIEIQNFGDADQICVLPDLPL